MKRRRGLLSFLKGVGGGRDSLSLVSGRQLSNSQPINGQLSNSQPINGRLGGVGGGGSNDLLTMHVKEYGGIPNEARVDVPPWRYDYAFTPVWDANFTGCTWKVSNCLDPLPASDDCVIYDCPTGRVACPPDDVPKCPGRWALGCGDH